MIKKFRYRAAAKAALAHFALSVVVALLAAVFVFGVWFPGAYRDIAGGTELFLLIVGVDIVCGPLLTLVLFNPIKSRRELFVDLGLIAVVQLAALAYGLFTVWQIRPLYLPFERDRFKVVSLSDLRGAPTDQLPLEMQPSVFKGPQVIDLRLPRDSEESSKVLMESLAGGADYGERPDFYIPMSEKTVKAAYAKGRPVTQFLARYPAQQSHLQNLASGANRKIEQLRFLPIRAKNDWVIVMSESTIVGFAPGDGF